MPEAERAVLSAGHHVVLVHLRDAVDAPASRRAAEDEVRLLLDLPHAHGVVAAAGDRLLLPPAGQAVHRALVPVEGLDVGHLVEPPRAQAHILLTSGLAQVPHAAALLAALGGDDRTVAVMLDHGEVVDAHGPGHQLHHLTVAGEIVGALALDLDRGVERPRAHDRMPRRGLIETYSGLS